MKRKYMLFILTVISATVLAGCGGGSNSSYKSSAPSAAVMEEAAEEAYYSDDVYDTYDADYSENGMESEPVEAKETSRKIIKTVNMNAETEEFDSFIANITNKVNALGGYMESTDISGRSINSDSDYLRNANITARIPSKKLDEFVGHVSENSNITNKSESAEDVTLSYADTAARISSLRTEQDRLNELIKQADNIDTLLALEERLAQVRYEIESFESQLRTMDNKVDYSTVYLYVKEVRKYTPVVTEPLTFGQRVSQGIAESFADVIEGFVNFIAEFIIAIPYLIALVIVLAFIGLILFVVVKILIKIIKKIDDKSRLNAEAKRRAINNSALVTSNQVNQAQTVNAQQIPPVQQQVNNQSQSIQNSDQNKQQ